jgi:hypothetical protein
MRTAFPIGLCPLGPVGRVVLLELLEARHRLGGKHKLLAAVEEPGRLQAHYCVKPSDLRRYWGSPVSQPVLGSNLSRVRCVERHEGVRLIVTIPD